MSAGGYVLLDVSGNGWTAPEGNRIGSTAKPNLRPLHICHVSAIQNRRDARAFNREATPCADLGLRLSLVGPHGENGSVNGVELRSLRPARNRALRILTAPRAVFAAAQLKADVYHIHSPEMIPAGLVLKFVFGKKVVYDTREDYPSMMLNKTYLRSWLRGIARSVLFVTEKAAARAFDGFVTADAGTLRNYARHGGSRKLVFYNLPNLQFFPDPVAADKSFDLVYRGGLSDRAGTWVLLQALKILAGCGLPATLLMFGYSDDQSTHERISSFLRDNRLDGLVTLRGIIPHEEMAATLQKARIAVCPLQKIPKFLNNIPVKVFESWACGLPVVATDLPPIRPFFPRNQRDLLVRPGDAEDLARAIEGLLRDPDRSAMAGRQARQAVEERFNSRGETKKLLKLYSRIWEPRAI